MLRDVIPERSQAGLPRSPQRIAVLGEPAMGGELDKLGFSSEPLTHDEFIFRSKRVAAVVLAGLKPESPVLQLLSQAHLLLEASGVLLLCFNPPVDDSVELIGRKIDGLASLAARCGFLLNEAMSSRARPICLVFQKGADPDLQLAEMAPNDLDDFMDLFRVSFGHDKYSAALWRWKYGDGRGTGIVARRVGRLIASYSTCSRRVVARGTNVVTVNVADTMVAPDARGGGAAGPFFQISSSYQDLFLKWRTEFPFGFGFAGGRPMAAATAFGLYADVGGLDVIRWTSESTGEPTTAIPVDPTDPKRWSDLINGLWDQQRRDLADAIVGIRDYDYVKHRYFAHPTHRYEVLFLEREGAVLMMKQDKDCYELVDFIGPLSSIPAVVAEARRAASRKGHAGLYAWSTPHNSHLFVQTGGTPKPHEHIRIAHAGRYPKEHAKDRWWLMTGDSDAH